MTKVRCRNIDCKWWEDGECLADEIEISYDFECETREDRDEWEEDEDDEV